MNNDQFDNLTRTLAKGISRRQALKMLGAGIASGLLSFRVSELVRAQEPPRCVVKTVKIWMKAFIPQDILGYTATVPDGPYRGQTMIPGPPFRSGPSGCFLTDQRDFSTDIDAKSRMTSIVVIDVEQARITNGRRGFHYSDLTTELNCSSGTEICKKTGPIKGKGFYDLVVSGDTITVKLESSASNPCIGGSSAIGYNGTIAIKLLNPGQPAQISFVGYIQAFPAFEMYASVDDGDPQAVIVQQSPEPDTTPWNLPRDPNRYVSGAVLLSSGCPDCTTCNPNTGTCEPVVCTDPCQECRDGICQDRDCGECMECNPNNGACFPVDCGDPCQACVDDACHPIACPDCKKCNPATGTCDPVVCDDPCMVCQNNTCQPMDCGYCNHCENGGCVQNCPECTECNPDTGTCDPVDCGDPCLVCEHNSCRVKDCGDCNHCENGVCIEGCADQDTCCGNQCVDTSSSSQHCGACNRACGDCMHCENGLCVRTCSDTEVCCGDQCINPSEYTCCITRDNGSLPCPPGTHCCASGECCPSDWQCCGGQCVRYDSSHCSNCFPCGTGQECCIGPQGQIYGCVPEGTCN